MIVASPVRLMLYFDHNATYPLSCAARDAWLDAVERYIGNPSSPHRLGTRADTALTQARERLAGCLQCAPGGIVWTSGATESNNAVLYHMARTTDGEAWISAIEHPCTMEATRRYFAGRHRFLPVTAQGVLDLDHLCGLLRKARPGLIGLMAANNETGVLQPWQAVRDLCREHGVAFFCDAAQWIGRMAWNDAESVDFMTGCAHKFGGPQGVGFLKCPPTFRPFVVGGAQEDGRRAGTENVAGVLAMVAALEDRLRPLSPEAIDRRIAMRRQFESDLREALPAVEVVGASANRLWNTVSAVMPELRDCRQRWVVKMDKLGFAVSTGSACASGKEQSSHVLTAMGIASGKASRVLRFSSGWETRPEDWQALRAGLQQAAQELAG